jgi:hypothetical protein
MAKQERKGAEQEPAESGFDAGAYIGHEPELAAETIPGGIQPGDERIAAGATQSTGPANRGANPDDGWSPWPKGHREGAPADDDAVRRKG